MIASAVKALSQMLSPPMRAILWKAIGLALVLIAILAIGLQRLLSWFASSGEAWLEIWLGSGWHGALEVVSWIVSIAAGLGVFLGAIFLMPAITSLIASLFVDDVAEQVERVHYPNDAPGTAPPLALSTWEGIKTALMTLLVYVIALPFVLFAGAGFIVFFLATAWLLGREYFELAAMRFRPISGGQGDAEISWWHRIRRRLLHRRVRFDPDRQPCHAGFRDGADGARA